MKEIFNQYCKIIDIKRQRKGLSKLPKAIKYIKFIPLAIFLCIAKIIFMSVLENYKEIRRKYPYRYNNKYKKVIKEGILFDTVEYHEK